MSEPANASITTVEHKQSLSSAHEVADRPSLPSQAEGLDNACDAIVAHTEPPRATPTIAEPHVTTKPTNPTINRAESTPRI